MKKTLFTIGFAALGMMNCLSAQDNFDADVLGQDPSAYVKVDTVDYIGDKVQNFMIGVSIGGSYSMGENTRTGNFWDMAKPSFQVEIGKFFYPQFGLRFTASYLNQLGRSEWEIAPVMDKYGQHNGNYKFSMASGFVDGVLNFHNIFWRYKEKRRFSLLGYMGVGALYTWFDQKQLDWLADPRYKNCIDDRGVQHKDGDKMGFSYIVNGKSRFYFAGHAGLIADIRLSDAWDLRIDGSFNGTDDSYNGVRYQRIYDTYVNLMAGVTYHFKDAKGNRRLRYSHYTDAVIVDDLNRQLAETGDELVEARKPIVLMQENVSYNEMLQTTVSFYIDKTFVTDAQKRNVKSVANFMETHPDIDVVITGYADAQTAYPKYNMMLSEKRAQAVYEILTQEYNVDPNRLSMDYKGDEIQPFEIVNEWNRAVVFFIKPHDADFVPAVQDKAKTIKANGHESSRLKQTGSKETRSAF